MLLGAALLAFAGQAQAFGFKDVAAQAQKLAAQPHQPHPSTLPDELKALSYDQSRDIRFKPERALWRQDKLPFELMFFHLGRLQNEPVLINEITADGKARHIAFNRDDFDYGKNKLSPQTWGDVGYSGFRVHYPMNTSNYKDEVIVFLGASYFRAIGAQQHYGLSARGLAIDTVGGQKEEFPRFSEFWIEKPKANAKSLVVYALMESPRATGAYRFEVKPGSDTVTDVQSQLYLRGPVATLGLVPLTSMFFSGENQPRPGDIRPEVHDSDGLMVNTGDGEWLWRPLGNPKRTLATSFAMTSLRGFGLMQRDRNFASYEDAEARYDRRPSAWITPQGHWGPGRVELVQLSTPDETNDNIVAYWVPEKLPAPGQPLNLNYQMRWQSEQQQRPPTAWVTQTRVGRGLNELAANEQQYFIDFAGPALDKLPEGAALKAAITSDANGEIVERNVYRNGGSRTWRLTLRVKQIQSTQPVELRASLQHGNDTVSETWTNVIPPQ
ncbi:MAG: glucan biosynthesis protein G [Rubrivivax sp.]|nr:MAG: glucan biosynthesis protein G [Rubrivivax sp.]